MKYIMKILITILIISLAIFFASPYYALHDLSNAIDRHDDVKVSQYIHYQKLQRNISNHLIETAQNRTNNWFSTNQTIQIITNSALSLAMDNVADKVVTPRNLRILFQTGLVPRVLDDQSIRPQLLTSNSNNQSSTVNIEYGYDGINYFDITIDRSGFRYQVVVTMERISMLKWQIVDVVIIE